MAGLALWPSHQFRKDRLSSSHMPLQHCESSGVVYAADLVMKSNSCLGTVTRVMRRRRNFGLSRSAALSPSWSLPAILLKILVDSPDAHLNHLRPVWVPTGVVKTKRPAGRLDQRSAIPNSKRNHPRLRPTNFRQITFAMAAAPVRGREHTTSVVVSLIRRKDNGRR